MGGTGARCVRSSFPLLRIRSPARRTEASPLVVGPFLCWAMSQAAARCDVDSISFPAIQASRSEMRYRTDLPLLE